MSVSNSSDFNQTRNEIIADALTTLGVYRPGATVSTADYNICSNWLNKIVKAWQAKGIHMWSEVEGTLYLREGINKYTISSSSTDNCGDNAVETNLTAAASSTTLTVTSTAGMTAADNVGIELDDGTRQFTTIVSVDSTTQLTITTGLTSAAASGNSVSTYTTASGKPLHVSSARFKNKEGTEKIVSMQGRDEFMSIPSKDNQGSSINQACYVSNRSDGTMYVYPTPEDASGRLKFSYARMLMDFDAAGDNPDLPSEWLECLTLNLMARVCGVYGKTLQERQEIKQEAAQSLIDMQLWDIDNGSIRVVPGYQDES